LAVLVEELGVEEHLVESFEVRFREISLAPPEGEIGEQWDAEDMAFVEIEVCDGVLERREGFMDVKHAGVGVGKSISLIQVFDKGEKNVPQGRGKRGQKI
jgi:hypothetical protein